MEQAPDAVTDHALYEPLTNRELEILQLLAQGLSNREIADKLVLALTTVKWYVRQIFEKLDVTRRREALAVAQRLGLLVDSLEVPSGALTQALPVGRNPYKGLRPFHQRDAHDFFGRDALTQRLLSRLGERGEDSRFLAVVGPSGSGKSSVVRAGLIPALQHGAMAGAENWVMADLLPGSHPFDELELALRRVAVERPGDLMEQLRRDESGLLRASRLILPDDGQLLLLIDQFEELFSLVNDPRVARRFLDLLYAASIDPHSSMRVLITLRADFYDRPLMIPDFSTLVRSRTEVVIPLTPAELEQAIVQPAQAAGVGVEPALVAALIAAVNDQPGTLPLLQYALTELFERREGRVMTLRAYERLGGVLGALTRQADEVYDDLDEPDQALTKQIFLRLVTLGEGTEDLRRRVLRSELTALAPDANRMSRLVDAFGASGLLTFDRDVRTQGPTVEVAHEALLREWWRLREWLEDSRADIRQQRVLSAAALEWERARHEKSYLLSGVRLAQFNGWAETALVALTPDEQQFLSVSVAMERQENLIRRRRRNLALAAAVVVALIMTVLAVITLDREQVAQRERDYARELALVNGAQAMLERDDIETALALALVANTTGSISGQAQEILSRAAYRPGPIQWFRGHSAAVLDSVYSPDGSRMISVDFAGGIMLWDVRTGKSLPLQGHNSGFAQNVDWSADGRSVLTASTDLSIIIWDAQTGEMIRRLSSAELTN
ncbi:MAG: hypothetical protein JNJ61_06905, partial [Anaerolineae bacterium]|nr:hypothetical protein [Anaerolineae bacterium]